LGGAFLLCGLAALILAAPLGAQQRAAQPTGVPEQTGALPENSAASNEPVSPLPQPARGDPERIALGGLLFADPRLSHDNGRSCTTCHDVGDNGATHRSRDLGLDGKPLQLNTPTLFNAAASFRLSWTGKNRSFEEQAKASIESPQIMGSTLAEAAAKLGADTELARRFEIAYGRAPDESAILDALATYERSLLTPDSRFDRWLEGDAAALTGRELQGYQLFKSLGCVSCHQGVNIGGNLLERHGIFHPLGAPEPEILRVPSLRNVATTPPYFHDGSAATLEDAVQRMGYAQLNTLLQPDEVRDIVAFLNTLTGNFNGRPVGARPVGAKQ
jgi:cytochrome c peroxidase